MSRRIAVPILVCPRPIDGKPSPAGACRRIDRAIVDTGADTTLIPYAVARRAGLPVPNGTARPTLQGATGEPIHTAPVRATVSLVTKGASRGVEIEVAVGAKDGAEIKEPLLGNDFLHAAACRVDMGEGVVICSPAARRVRTKR